MWRAIVINPDGLVIDGEFGGVHVPVNTAFVFGDYKIVQTSPKDERVEKSIIIHYKSQTPVIPTEYGALIRYELENDKFGDGLEKGVIMTETGKDGLFSTLIRLVVFFPDFGGEGNKDE